MEAKSKITFVLPELLQRDFRNQIVQDGYDLRGKSRWIIEGIEQLFMMSNYPELVKLSHEMKGFERTEYVVITKDYKKILDDAVMNIRLSYPTLEGVQSCIVRTAILQRLLKSG